MPAPPTGLSRGLLALFAVLCAGNARADDLAFHTSIDPGAAVRARSGELLVNAGQETAFQAPSGWLGIVGARAAYGFPPLGPLGPTALRIDVPVLESRTSIRMGSPLAALGTGGTILRGKALTLGTSIEIGGVAPSPGGETLRIAGSSIAERRFVLTYGLSVPLTIRALDLSAVFWSTPFANYNAELAYAPRHGAAVFRAGFGFATADQPARAFGAIAWHLDRTVEISAFASVGTDRPSDGSIVGLSATWSAPTEATRTVPWEGADARVLREGDVRDRELAALGVPGKITIVEFGARWCAPCRAARPHLEQLARRPDVAVRMIDADECEDFATRSGVAGLPTFVVIDRSGRIVRRIVGFPSPELDAMLP